MSELTAQEVLPKEDLPSEVPDHQNPLVAIRESRIHGMGLFARELIEEGAVIGVYEGNQVLEGEDGDDGEHVLWIYDEDEDREPRGVR